MKNKKKLCIYTTIMLLGLCSFTVTQGYCDEVTQEKNAVNVEKEEIKANQETLDKAAECMKNKDYSSAIVYLTNYIEAKPKKYEAYKMRGECFYALRQYNLAQYDFQKAVDLKTSDDKFITGTKVLSAMVLGADKEDQYQNPELGNLYGMLMYAQKALNSPAYEASYQKAVEYNSHIYLPKPKKEDIAKINCPQKYGKLLDPQGVDEYIYGAIEDIENGNYAESIYKSQYITTNYPKYYLGYYLTGVSLVGVGKETAAVSAFENALKYNPYDFESFASLGQIYFQMAEETFSSESANKSIDYFNKALKYNPNCYLYYYYIGLNQLQLGNYDLAVKNFNSAIKYNSNDYNSMYYKLIAQYILGEYSTVTSGATRLLYRHVSNYNSVLYLRALSQYKQGYFEDALSDIEKIHNNMNDIYNADVKKLSKKEKTLDSYLYYLKAQIIQQKGLGVKADLQKAMQNPIIANLSRVENATKQYTKALNDSDISIEDYNKYKKFYETQLQGMLNSNLVITYDDIDNQYDYLRTTFDSLGLTFEYIKPNYKFTTIDNYAYKKYGSKLAEATENSVSQDKENEKIATPELKKSTDPSETLAGDNSSIAQMLASQSLAAIPVAGVLESDSVENQKEEVSNIDESESKLNDLADTTVGSDEKFPNEDKLAENNSDIPKLRTDKVEQVEHLQKTEINETSSEVIDKKDNKDEILSNTKTVESDIADDANEDVLKNENPEPIVISAPVKKESETFEIVKAPQKVQEVEKVENVQNVETVENEPEWVDTSKSTQEVKEKETNKVKNEILQPSTEDKASKQEQAKSSVEEQATPAIKSVEDEKSDKIEKIEEPEVQKETSKSVEKTIDNSNNNKVNTIDEKETLKSIENQNQEIQNESSTESIENPSIDKKFEEIKTEEKIDKAIEPEDVSIAKPVQNIVEKQAKVHNITESIDEEIKAEPKLKEGDEVVVFVPKTFMSKAEENLARNSIGLTNPNIVTDDFSAIRNKAELNIEQQNKGDSNLESTVDLTEDNTSKNIKAENKSSKVKQKTKKQDKKLIVKDDENFEQKTSAQTEEKPNAENEKVQQVKETVDNENSTVAVENNIKADDTSNKTEDLESENNASKDSAELAIGSIIQSAFLGSDKVNKDTSSDVESVTDKVLENAEDTINQTNSSQVQNEPKENKSKKLKKNKKENQEIKAQEPVESEQLEMTKQDSTKSTDSEVKSKKSWFGLFKKKDKQHDEITENEKVATPDTENNKPEASDNSSADNTTENVSSDTELQNKNIEKDSKIIKDEQASDLESVSDEQKEDIQIQNEESTPDDTNQQVQQNQIPDMRTQKEVLDENVVSDKVAPQKEKKKFRWWWQKDKKDKNIKDIQGETKGTSNKDIENPEVENVAQENNLETTKEEKESSLWNLFKKKDKEKNKDSENVVKEKKVIKELSK